MLIDTSSGSKSENTHADGTSDGPESATMEDCACVLGLPKKDFGRPANVNQLDGVSTKQLAYALSCVDNAVTASDVLECGGEHVPWMQRRCIKTFMVAITAKPSCCLFLAVS